MRTAGILLTGGASSRMGTDKAQLVVRGETLAQRAARVLGATSAPCVEVGPGHSDLPAVREVPPGSGPLAALVAGWWALRMDTGHDGAVLVLAVDMPRVEAPLLALIAEAGDEGETVIPEAGGRLQPLCARYARDVLSTADRLTAAGERSMRALLAAVPHRTLAEDAWAQVAPPDAFADLDAPSDVAALSDLAGPSDAGREVEGP